MSIVATIKQISNHVQAQNYQEALVLCKNNESLAENEKDHAFIFWNAAGQCAVYIEDWKLAERYLSKASICISKAQPIQIQKNLKVYIPLYLPIYILLVYLLTFLFPTFFF